jgi:hypothetical protein
MEGKGLCGLKGALGAQYLVFSATWLCNEVMQRITEVGPCDAKLKKGQVLNTNRWLILKLKFLLPLITHPHRSE